MKQLEAKSLVLLKHHLKVLRLPTIGTECEKVAAQAAADNVDHLSYLLQLLELELLDREKRAAERRMKAAKFPTLKTLDTFDFTARPSINKVEIAELARCEFIDKHENVIMVGNPGTGKSHLATGIAAAACQKGYRVRFYRVTELVTALIEARDERAFLRLKGTLARLDLLVLDELGYVPATKVGAELLFDVISTAYERTSLVVTSNLPFESWTEVLGSERLTGATLDRLTHRCRIIETKGESYRLRHAKTRNRQEKTQENRSEDEAPDVLDAAPTKG
jgi:DNA replication protein DnaC